jgi:hypothetical protein
MRTKILSGGSGAVVGVVFTGFLFRQASDVPWNSIVMWFQGSLIFLPCVANSLLAVYLHRKRHSSVWLLVLPAPWLIVYYNSVIKADAFFMIALVTWLAGCVGLLMAGLSEPLPTRSTADDRSPLE